MGFRENVLQILENQSISQTELADRLKKSPQNISIILKKNNPSQQTVQEFAKALGVDVVALIDDGFFKIKHRFFEALKFLSDTKVIDGMHDFARIHNISPGSLVTMKNSDRLRFPLEFLSILVDDYGVSSRFLLSGTGDILENSDGHTSNSPNLKSSEDFELIRNESGTSFRKLGGDRYLIVTPLIESYLTPDYTEHWQDISWIMDLPKHAIVADALNLGVYRTFEVPDNSMDDQSIQAIKQSDIITGIRFEPKLWRKAMHGHNDNRYILQTTGKVFPVNILRVGLDLINCGFSNPDKIKFPNVTIKFEEIKELYRVEAIDKRIE